MTKTIFVQFKASSREAFTTTNLENCYSLKNELTKPEEEPEVVVDTKVIMTSIISVLNSCRTKFNNIPH